MTTKMKYQYLEKRPDKRSQEMFVSRAGIRASTIWHDRYVSRQAPDQIAKDHDIPLEAVYEALAYCQENWEQICHEKDLVQQLLKKRGFFKRRSSNSS